MLCKLLRKVFFRNDRSSRMRQEHPSPTPPNIVANIPNPANVVITNSTVNVVGRNQNNYDHLHSGPILESNARVPDPPTVVDNYYTTTGNPAPYLNVYPVYGVLNSPVLLSPFILMNASGQAVTPSFSSHKNQARHRDPQLNNLSECLCERADGGAMDRRGLDQHEGQTHTPREVSTPIEHPFRVSATTHLERMPIAPNRNCCSRHYSPSSYSDFVVGSSTGPTVDRQFASHETNLTAHRQSCAYVPSPTHLPRPLHDHSCPTNGVDLSPSSFPPSPSSGSGVHIDPRASPTAISNSFACHEHPSRAGTSTMNCDGMAVEQLLNSPHFEQPSGYASGYVHCVCPREMSQGTSPQHTVSPECRFRSRSLESLAALSTISELTRSQSLPVDVTQDFEGRSESRPSSPRPVP